MYSEANWMGYSECTSPEGVVRRGESRSAIWTPLRAAPFRRLNRASNDTKCPTGSGTRTQVAAHVEILDPEDLPSIPLTRPRRARPAPSLRPWSHRS
jgi:hypothetical protein